MASKDNNKNPRNPQSRLFRQLTKLFSGPIINYRTQTPRKERRRNLDKYNFTSASGKQFKKTSYDPFENLTSNIMSNQNRIERYGDFDQMEYEPIIASALDIYADEMSTSSELQNLLTIKCPNEEIKGILDNLYHNILNVEFNLFGWCRSMCKFGDYFLYLDIDQELGVRNVIGLPGQEIERMEAQDDTNPNYVQYQWNSGGLTLENWQVAHFRILGNDKYAPYGTSILEPARRIWRQLILLEDAMMAYRIVRSPERRIFYIDVGNIPPEDVEQFMQRAMTQMKRNQVIDSDTGRVDLRYNPLSIEEDYFIPVRGGASTRVESLPGGTYTGDIDDVKYLKDKLFAALKVPQAYLFRGEDAGEADTTLAQKDIRFARTIQRLQRSVLSELEKVGIIHLFTLGYRQDDLVSFKLSLNNPSKIAELQELEQWRTKFETATGATEGFFSKRWVAKNLFNLSDEEFVRNQREMFYDRRFDAALEAAAAGEGIGDEKELGLDMAGIEEEPEDLGLEEPGEEAPPEDAPADEPAAEETETALLEPVAKRDDAYDDADWYKLKKRKTGETTTSKSKSKWYLPVKSDKRDMGARNRSYKSKYSHEKGKNTQRNIHKGYPALSSLGKGIYEENETTYSNEERKLFEVHQEVRNLITELESKDNEIKTQQEA
tara:strand:+ start:1021 stop:3003 length:1983 start_codon:yes stop_codon:yes gene_type:complete